MCISVHFCNVKLHTILCALSQSSTAWVEVRHWDPTFAYLEKCWVKTIYCIKQCSLLITTVDSIFQLLLYFLYILFSFFRCYSSKCELLLTKNILWGHDRNSPFSSDLWGQFPHIT